MTTAVAPTTTFTEVLIATDFGQESDWALAYAKSVVRASDGELLLVHVAEPEPHIGIPEGGWVGDRVQDCRQRGLPVLTILRAQVKAENPADPTTDPTWSPLLDIIRRR